MAFVFLHPRKGREMSLLFTQNVRFLDQLWAVFDQAQPGIPKLTQNYSTHGKGRGPQDVTYISKNPEQLPRIFKKCLWPLHRIGNVHRSYWTLQRLRVSVHKRESAMRQAVCVPLTRLLICLLVWPDDRAEVGEDQRAQSAGSFLWSAVVVEGILAQHEPVPTLLDPVASHLPQQPPFKSDKHRCHASTQLQNEMTQLFKHQRIKLILIIN